ncbi:hypothetical protein GC167_01045 [bacterium]|nr:hypothetical protein [bacterium]
MGVLLFVLCTLPALGQNRAETQFTVQGVCGMCKERIETALDVKGVIRAEWSEETHKVFVVYNPKKIEIAEMHRLVQNAGHDTDCGKASDEAYAKVHGCCKYREEPEHDGHGSHDGHGHH